MIVIAIISKSVHFASNFTNLDRGDRGSLNKKLIKRFNFLYDEVRKLIFLPRSNVIQL